MDADKIKVFLHAFYQIGLSEYFHLLQRNGDSLCNLIYVCIQLSRRVYR